MVDETSEIETEEKEEEIIEYDLIIEDDGTEKLEKREKPKPKKTKIIRDQKVEGLDYCPFCKSENLGRDYKQNLYCCLNPDCGRIYQVAKS